jgi:hypothetical protein
MNTIDDTVGPPIMTGDPLAPQGSTEEDEAFIALFLRMATTVERAMAAGRPLVLARVEDDAFIVSLTGHPSEDQEWAFQIPEDESTDSVQKHMIYMIQTCCEHYDADTDPLLCQIMCGFGGSQTDIIELLAEDPV